MEIERKNKQKNRYFGKTFTIFLFGLCLLSLSTILGKKNLSQEITENFFQKSQTLI